MKKSLLLAALATVSLASASHASEGAEFPAQNWSFNGLHGSFDKAQLLRGYQVFTNVCMACHSAKYISHRDLMDAGFTEAEVQTLAKNLNMKLDAKFLTAQADADAVAAFGKVPPDLSLITKAREGMADYVYAVLTGYSENPEEIQAAFPNGLPENAHFNTAFPGHAIAMPAPLAADAVTYEDGTKATVEQEAQDVVTFLQWASDPAQTERKHLGVYVLIYLVIFSALAYALKRTIWKNVKH